jgi:PHD/YefM family antitoxin component YafN of YafNO toxin-antitoxin module
MTKNVKKKSMTTQQIYAGAQRVEIKKIGKKSVALLPLELWLEIEEQLEDMEMARSKTLARQVKKARSERKTYSLEDIKKELNL